MTRHMRPVRSRSSGFTIIELTFAMVFVAFLLVFMALTIVQMLRTYDKAISMKQINQAGRSITEDINQSMRLQLPGAVNVEATNINDGFLCVGRTVYHWRPLYTGTTLAGADPVTGIGVHDAVVADPDDATGPTMVKKQWRNGTTDCTYDNVTNPAKYEEDPATLLSSRSRVVWASATPSGDNRLITLRFIIGTYDRTEFVPSVPVSTKYLTPQKQPSGTVSCLPGNDGNYCAFAEFKTIVYVSGN